MKHKYYLLLIGLSTAFNVIAAENATKELAFYKDKVEHAIVKFENTQRSLWSYTVSRYEDEEGDISSSIEQHSPQINDKWLLKQINGQAPTQKQHDHFIKEKRKQSDTRQGGDNLQFKLRNLIDQESLSLVSSNDEKFVMAFNVNLKKLGKNSVGKLQGQLVYQKDKQFIEKIDVWNNAEFSPVFTAKITDLAITFTFLYIDGAILTKENKMKMRGSFAYFTEINESSLDTFSEYQYQGKRQ